MKLPVGLFFWAFAFNAGFNIIFIYQGMERENEKTNYPN